MTVLNIPTLRSNFTNGEDHNISESEGEAGRFLIFCYVFVYTEIMLMIVWDEPKRQTNLAKHGLDFTDLDEGFFLASVVVPAKDGRQMAIGQLADGTIAVVFATLGIEGVSVISMRPASRKERTLL
ncbi:BrnT family toxin [Phaeobacter gallaeciensis]|uniref:BrnT family toxin n=1 Tax=Phaeobacter gallaeciensis TaxID=60890 RepID=UPI00237F068F|nr:BrnT family toxin [Phaeobacter gallaeciensis]MDE4063878.1 BrnT family toxin [Phaeobacter gallaeciensis]MDE4126902.1 BrnT family toxin [Phaeobacter gallaeciensis]MDE4131373.1 BrnT family toxin [Phaeobacter gallaeciensis]